MNLLVMEQAHLDAVMAIEQQAYEFPWTRGNFVDSLASGHQARVLWEPLRPPGQALLGYFVAMEGVDEMHLLNITVAPAEQGRGYARLMLAGLVRLCHRLHTPQLWLEVRDSNTRARRLYQEVGFQRIGQRKGYYPAAGGRREDAVVMRLDTPAPPAAALSTTLATTLAFAPNWAAHVLD